MGETPFNSIESAHEYVGMLARQVAAVQSTIQGEIADATREHAARRLDTLRLVDYKLKQLVDHLGASRRIMNDLQMLRRLLLGAPTDIERRYQATPR